MDNDFILILDFGGTQAQSMARKLRSQNYYCEIHPCDIDVAAVRRQLKCRGALVDKKDLPVVRPRHDP